MGKMLLTLRAVALLTGIVGTHHAAAAQAKDDKAPAASKAQKAAADKEAAPLVCNLEAMTPAQRKQYEAVKKRLRAAVKEVKELPNGYAFRYAAKPDLLMAAAEFITRERECCSFYSFTLEVVHDGGPMWLRITGPKETKSFIKSALAS